jgi:hypothetical protein
MTRTRSDRPYGWPAEPAANRRHELGDSMSVVAHNLTHELLDRRMLAAATSRTAAAAPRERRRFVVQFRGTIGGAITAFGRALAGEHGTGSVPTIARAMPQPARRDPQPGC